MYTYIMAVCENINCYTRMMRINKQEAVPQNSAANPLPAAFDDT